jgi:hypothetical protein
MKKLLAFALAVVVAGGALDAVVRCFARAL